MLHPREADVPFLFLVLVVLPLVTYILLGIWNEAAKKKARISVLAQLAAEEAFNVQETTQTDVIPTQVSSKTIGYVCARCFSPATTRCARCKAVRYCSGKCQIVHWRQGHREECQQWQDSSFNPVSTFATESVQPGDSIDEKLTPQVLGNDMNGPRNYVVSSNFSNDPYVTFSATSPDTMVTTSKVSASEKKLLDKGSRNVSETDMHCYASVACSSEESIGSGVPAPAFHSTTLHTENLSKDIPSRYKAGTENITDSDETHRSQDKSHIFSKEPSTSKIIMHQSHESKGKMRHITKPISSPEMSSSLPMDGNVMYDSESGLLFTSEKEDVQEGKHFSSGETFELRPAAERNSDKRSVKYIKPPYTLGSTLSSSKKSVDKVPEEHYFPGIKSASCFENESKISHKSVYMNNPLQSSHGFSDMADMKMAGPRKSLKVPGRKLVGFMSCWKKNKVLFPYEDLVKLFQCEGWDISPRGLLNCGNSCYANAVLQCLTYTKPLMIYLLQRLHSRTCRVRHWCLMCEVEQHVSMLRDGGGPLSPNRILSNMKNIGWRMGDGNQEDAHEFLRLLVMSMQSICLDGLGGEKKVDPVLQETTLIQQIFGGRLQSKVKCMRCRLESERYENIMDLTLEIHGWVESLEDALTQFTAPEDLDGENMYRCRRCSEYVKARKQLSVHEVPNILTVVLKRFQTGKYGKINKFVTFPEMLDMIPFMTGTADNPPLYVLYAVVVHLDTLNASFSGHYVSYVKDLQGAWFRIDDSEVQAVPLSQVMSEGAYMLFYSRSFPRPPRAYLDKSLLRVPSPSITPKTSKYPRHGQDKQNGTLLASENSSNNGDDFRPEYSEGIEEYTQRSTRRNINLSREMYGDPFSMDLSDATSTSDWSLFTSSDESSFTTESTRDSFSTVDYGDSASLDAISSIFSPFYGPEYSHSDTITCKKFSSCKSETRFLSESRGFVLDSFMPTQHPGNVHRGRNP